MIGGHVVPTFDPSTHTYRSDAGIVVPSVTQILRALGLSPAFYSPKRLPDGRIIDAREFGAAVHEDCFAWERGEVALTDMDDAIRPYVVSYGQWLKLGDYTHATIEWERASLFEAVPYSGRCDRLVQFPQERVVVDEIKTGQLYPHYRLQIAAYMRMFNACLGAIVVLQDDGSVPRVVHINRTDPEYETWLGCVRLYHWRASHGQHHDYAAEP